MKITRKITKYYYLNEGDRLLYEIPRKDILVAHHYNYDTILGALTGHQSTVVTGLEYYFI